MSKEAIEILKDSLDDLEREVEFRRADLISARERVRTTEQALKSSEEKFVGILHGLAELCLAEKVTYVSVAVAREIEEMETRGLWRQKPRGELGPLRILAEGLKK